jgi:Peptidase family M28
MSAADTANTLASFEGRGAGTDAERRAARWLATELTTARTAVRIEPFWCRPNWALTHAWHVLLGLAGSLVAVSSPRIGGALVLAAVLSVIVDERLGLSPGRRLTFEHASQNVVAITKSPARAPDQPPARAPDQPPARAPDRPPARAPDRPPARAPDQPPAQAPDQPPVQPPVHLIITANYDAGRTGFVYREDVRRPFTRATASLGRLGPLWPGWLGWITVALALLLLTAILRLGGDRGTVVGILQFVPTVGLVLALALLIEIASSKYSPAASDNATGVAVAMALAGALAAAPPRRMTVEVVLQGAGDGFGIGLRNHLRARRGTLTQRNTVVLGIAASGAGRPHWWLSDGQLVPLRYFKGLAQLCAQIAREQTNPTASPHRGRGGAPAFRATSARLPAIAIGCLNGKGLPPRSHRATDTADALEAPALDATVQFGLMLVDAIDAFLRDQPSGRRNRIALRRPLPVLAGREREPPDQLSP